MDLPKGVDFRLPEYRREVFLRFYEFHLKYRAHPGGVYYLMPYLAKVYDWDIETKLWYAFINGCTQNPVTSLIILRRFPRAPLEDTLEIDKWFNENWHQLPFDTDRRYQKKDFPAAVVCYSNLVKEAGSQQSLLVEDFNHLWNLVRKQFYSFGRLATFSYLEYLRIMGLGIDCPSLFMRDMSGSKSHRNGLAKVLGRDDLDWHKSTDFDGKYGPGEIDWLIEEGEKLLAEARARFAGRDFIHDVDYFTLESTLCCYKGWYRKNRRYPNIYNDMLRDRIVAAQKLWPQEDLQVFWDAREAYLPCKLRVEDCPRDPGLKAAKQNHFRDTGQVVMMDHEWPCFENDRSWEI